jgi:SPP1 family predicted phage head-tail adaptor
VTAAGKLDRLVTIQQATTAQDATGEYIETWSTLTQVWAKQYTQRPNETYRNYQRQAEKITIWEIRWRASFLDAHKYRLTYAGQTYDILGMEEIGRQRGIYLHTKIKTVV